MTSERGSGEAPESAPDEPEQECEDGTFTSAIARLEEVSDTFNAAFQALETITCAEKVLVQHRVANVQALYLSSASKRMYRLYCTL